MLNSPSDQILPVGLALGKVDALWCQSFSKSLNLDRISYPQINH